jgi:hypothetical protein
VADLEADVDEPTEGEWEELDVAATEISSVRPFLSAPEVDEPPQIVASHALSTESPNQETSSSTESVNNIQAGYSPEELMANLDINDRGRTEETEIRPEGLSSPIDIAGPRRSVSRRRSIDESEERRTPSPRTRSADILSGVDGPMTPRNDAGPFIFDGSGGARGADRANTPNMGAVVG